MLEPQIEKIPKKTKNTKRIATPIVSESNNEKIPLKKGDYVKCLFNNEYKNGFIRDYGEIQEKEGIFYFINLIDEIEDTEIDVFFFIINSHLDIWYVLKRGELFYKLMKSS